MAHYAFVDENNIVIEVIVGKDENELLEGLTPEEWYSDFKGKRCIRTSYNGTIRKNYAGVGFSYDSVRDAFIPPKCHDQATLDEDLCLWKCQDASHETETQ